MLPVVDDTSPPILLIVSPPVMDMAWVERQKHELGRVHARNERFAVISYSGFVKTMPGARERRALTEWINTPEQREVQKQLCVASSTQLDSAPKRAFLQALLWMWDPPYPHVVHATLEESLDWCTARLTEAGIYVPTRLRTRVLTTVRQMHTAHDEPMRRVDRG